MSLTDIPVTVIGGYLGAGKTTLVNHLLRHSGLRLAVLVNEFGELPIDHDLIEAEGDTLVSIAGGCVCCAFGDDLGSALLRVQALSPRPDHILLEASGVSIPSSILAALIFAEGLRNDGIVVLADAAGIRQTAVDRYLADTIARQLRDADIIVLNKADLVDEAGLAETEGWLRERVPGARVIPAIQGAVPASALLGALAMPRQGHRMTGHAEGLFISSVLRPGGPVDAAELARQLARPELGLVRAKGFVENRDGGWALIQVVGERWSAEPVETAPQPGVVCIGLRGTVDDAALAQIFAAHESAA